MTDPSPAPLLTVLEMALYCQTTEDVIAADSFAMDVRQKVSDLIRLKAGHPAWDNVTAPVDVRMVAIWVCRRTYLNTDQEVQTGVGPLSSRVLDQAALLTNFTDSELATIEGYNTAVTETEGMWTLRISGNDQRLPPTIYAPDDSMSDWEIPMFDVNDVNQAPPQ